MRKSGVYLIGFVLFLLMACDDVDTSQLSVNYDFGYFPVDSGAWIDYEVTYIVIDKSTDVYDTIKYYLKEEVAGIFIDAGNDTLNLLNRYYKDSLIKDWSLYSVWYLGVIGNEAIQVEENIKYLKQKFPLKLNSSWNGNAYNRTDTLGEFNYIVTSIDIPQSVNNLHFDSVLTVSQRDFTSVVEKYYFVEKYAYNIGLLEKEKVDIYSEEIDLTIPIEERVTKGTMYYQKIIDYGKKN